MAYYRKSFGLRNEIQDSLNNLYESEFINNLRLNGGKYQVGNLTFHLAKVFGFCWGVDRAISMAFECAKYFQGKQIWITNEIIHNPLVNNNLVQMNIKFIPKNDDNAIDFSLIQSEDVVILPAFGVSHADLLKLNNRGCQIVDTTCPWVSRVWHRIEKYQNQDFTAIIHGKYDHEETIATASRSYKFLIVQNYDEAKWVANFMLDSGDTNEFLQKFKLASSKDFNPETDLAKIGIANQTTMLKGETELIGKLFEETIIKKYGPHNINEHFMSPGDTICDATQERQDAMYNLIKEPIDMVLVIGGFNSSNTGHLQEIAESSGLKSYHIDGVDCLVNRKSIKHKIAHSGKITLTQGWLQNGLTNIGITSGASTPNQVVASVISRVVELAIK